MKRKKKEEKIAATSVVASQWPSSAPTATPIYKPVRLSASTYISSIVNCKLIKHSNV